MGRFMISIQHWHRDGGSDAGGAWRTCLWVGAGSRAGRDSRPGKDRDLAERAAPDKDGDGGERCDADFTSKVARGERASVRP
jgi:hypothetical protein